MNLVNLVYLIVVLFVACAAGFAGYKIKKSIGFIAVLVVLGLGYIMHVSYFENMFAKRFGGVLNVSTPAGHYHLVSTWKDDNLWQESFDPKTNSCVFREWSRSGVLEGEVRTANCNPAVLLLNKQ
jgi:hypothetical protein